MTAVAVALKYEEPSGGKEFFSPACHSRPSARLRLFCSSPDGYVFLSIACGCCLFFFGREVEGVARFIDLSGSLCMFEREYVGGERFIWMRVG